VGCCCRFGVERVGEGRESSAGFGLEISHVYLCVVDLKGGLQFLLFCSDLLNVGSCNLCYGEGNESSRCRCVLTKCNRNECQDFALAINSLR
jgi:hypothetical protein